MHSHFLKKADRYDKTNALEFLNQNSFPNFFELCKTTDLQLYNNFIAKTFENYETVTSFNIKPLNLLSLGQV